MKFILSLEWLFVNKHNLIEILEKWIVWVTIWHFLIYMICTVRLHRINAYFELKQILCTMGFDNECILNIRSLAREYFCPVCRQLVYPNEALQSSCTHLYCKPCLTYIASTTRTCPYDGYLVTQADSKVLYSWSFRWRQMCLYDYFLFTLLPDAPFFGNC